MTSFKLMEEETCTINFLFFLTRVFSFFSAKAKMSGAGGPSNFLGTRVMLTSLTEIRYSGTLHEIREPPYGSCITLANVISYGSEGRKGRVRI